MEQPKTIDNITQRTTATQKILQISTTTHSDTKQAIQNDPQI